MILREGITKGAAFEYCDMPGMTLEGGFHVTSKMKVARFKDSDGNILNRINH
jgi:hypothetical protein